MTGVFGGKDRKNGEAILRELEHAIAGEISQALRLVEHNDLREIDGAAKAMPEIAAMAKALHARLEQLCDGGPAGEAA